MLETVILPVVMILVGGFCAFSAAMNYPWFMNHRKALFMRRLLGDALARIFYITLGIAVTVAGLTFLIVGVPQA